MLEEKEKKRILRDVTEALLKVLPGAEVEGQPFWGLMETARGKLTSNYFVIPLASPPSHIALPLFLRETDAEIFRTTRKEEDIKKYVVRGFTQEQICMLALFGKEDKILFMVFQKSTEGNNDWTVVIYDPAELTKEFLE